MVHVARMQWFVYTRDNWARVLIVFIILPRVLWPTGTLQYHISSLDVHCPGASEITRHMLDVIYSHIVRKISLDNAQNLVAHTYTHISLFLLMLDPGGISPSPNTFAAHISFLTHLS